MPWWYFGATQCSGGVELVDHARNLVRGYTQTRTLVTPQTRRLPDILTLLQQWPHIFAILETTCRSTVFETTSRSSVYETTCRLTVHETTCHLTVLGTACRRLRLRPHLVRVCMRPTVVDGA